MASEDAQKAREEFIKKQQMVSKQWKAIASQYRLAMDDLFEYIDGQREMYRKYAEERVMTSPNGQEVVLNNDTVAILLQNGRGMNIVKTYIQSRIDSDVAQPTTK